MVLKNVNTRNNIKVFCEKQWVAVNKQAQKQKNNDAYKCEHNLMSLTLASESSKA